MIFLPTNLKYLRESKGLTQGQLAEMIGVRPNTVSNYENGNSSPDFETLGKIIKIFEVDAQFILYTDLRTETPVRRVSDVSASYNPGNTPEGRKAEENEQLEQMRMDIEELKAAMSRLLDGQ